MKTKTYLRHKIIDLTLQKVFIFNNSINNLIRELVVENI